MSKALFRTLALAAALVLAPLAGHAFTVSYQDITGPKFDKHGTNGRANARIRSTADPVIGRLRIDVGGFALRGDLDGDAVAESFTGWCLDISTKMKNGTDYIATSVPFSQASDPNARTLSNLQVSNIGKLFDTAYGTLNLADNTQSAAFQLALWEIIYEKNTTFGIGLGTFTATSNAAVITQANSLLANLNALVPKAWNLLFLQSMDGPDRDRWRDSQNLVTATAAPPPPPPPPPVPLPGAMGLLLLGLGGLALLRRHAA